MPPSHLATGSPGSRTTDRSVGVVGLGNMGMPVATALLAGPCPVVAYDLRAAAVHELGRRGARRASGPADLADCRIVSVLAASSGPDPLNDDAAAATAVRDVLEHLAPGATIIVHSTVRPGTVLELAELASARGVDMLDAPVSGGDFNAERGDLTLMVGGDDAVVRRCRPHLELIGRLHHVGPLSTGSALKLINNAMQAGHYALACEAFAIAAAHGIPAGRFREVVLRSSGRCWSVEHLEHLDGLIFRHTLAGDPRFAEIFSKDAHSAMSVAHGHGVRVPLIALVQELLPEIILRRRAAVSPREETHHG